REIAGIALRVEHREVVREGAATPAVLLGDRAAQQTELAGLEPHLTVDTTLRIPLLGLAHDLAIEELAREIVDGRDLVVVPGGDVLLRHRVQVSFSQCSIRSGQDPRSSRLRSLPLWLRGRTSTKRTALGTLNGARRRLTWSIRVGSSSS